MCVDSDTEEVVVSSLDTVSQGQEARREETWSVLVSEKGHRQRDIVNQFQREQSDTDRGLCGQLFLTPVSDTLWTSSRENKVTQTEDFVVMQFF